MIREGAISFLASEQDSRVEAQPFHGVDAYTTFSAEFTFKGKDIVFHFFQTEEQPSQQYWRNLFPKVLDSTAREFFKAEHPTLEASLVEGVCRASASLDAPAQASWWMAAHGFAEVPDPKLLAENFLAKLDQDLDKVSTTNLG